MSYLTKLKNNTGFTLIESLIYISIFIIISTTSLGFLFSLNDLFFQITLKERLLNSATVSMERILLEIKEADSVTVASSVLASSTAGVLVLENENTTIRIEKDGNEIDLYNDGVFDSTLNLSTVEVPQLTFFHYIEGGIELVRVEMKLQSSLGTETEELKINGSAVLRGSYASN